MQNKGPDSFFPYASPVVSGPFVKKDFSIPMDQPGVFCQKSSESLYEGLFLDAVPFYQPICLPLEFWVGMYGNHDLIDILNGSMRVENRRGHMWKKDQFEPSVIIQM